MVARQLKPCGTEAAYRRHLRNGEPACDKCRAAHQGQNAASENARRPKLVSIDGGAAHQAPAEPAADAGVFDPLVDARQNYESVKTAMLNALPRELPALSKRRQELVALIVELGGKQEVSLADQLAERRRLRSSGS